MKKRVFVAVNLSENIKKRLKEFREKYDYLPVRWTKEASLHLTLIFIGYVSDEQMLEICRVSREKASKTEPFFINFKRIILGPPASVPLRGTSAGKPDKPPRMIWVEGDVSQELTNLKNQLEDALLDSNSGFRHKEVRSMRPHITLARIKMEQWRQMESAPQIDEEFQAQVPVASIEVMESDLRSDGAEYMVLESCPIG